MLRHLMEVVLKLKLVEQHPYEGVFTREDALSPIWDATYSEWVSQMPKKKGVYLFSSNENILYIGACGKIAKQNTESNWKLPQRLKATRGQNNGGKDVLTSTFLKEILCTGQTSVKRYNDIPKLEISELKITVLPSTEKVPPTYIESVLIYEFYKRTEELPLLNMSF